MTSSSRMSESERVNLQEEHAHPPSSVCHNCEEILNMMNNQMASVTEIKNLLQEVQLQNTELIKQISHVHKDNDKETTCCSRLTIYKTAFMLFLTLLSIVIYRLSIATPEKYYSFATGEGLKLATVDERATVILHVMDVKGKAYTVTEEAMICELASDMKSMYFKKLKCSVQKNESGQYEISYQPTSRRRHQLHIKVEGDHIIGSPFSVIVLNKLSTPTNIISGVAAPQGIAFNENGDIFVAEYRGHSVSVFCPSGEKLQSFGSKGSELGQFNHPCAIAVDDDGNVLVADGKNHRIQKFTSEGKFITAAGRLGTNPLEFDFPVGIGIHPHTKKMYIMENKNHRIQILNPDLSFHKMFGSHGKGEGQFNEPKDVAFDSIGNVYVADNENHRIQVFTKEGEFLRQFRKEAKGEGELNYPTGISITSDDVVYVTELYNYCVSVFTSDGVFLKSFGRQGNEPGQFIDPRGIAVDENGTVYVSDHGNNRIQLFGL